MDEMTLDYMKVDHVMSGRVGSRRIGNTYDTYVQISRKKTQRILMNGLVICHDKFTSSMKLHVDNKDNIDTLCI